MGINEIGKIKISDFKSLGEMVDKIQKVKSSFPLSGEIIVYEDSLMNGNQVYSGRKGNGGTTFLIVGTKVAKIISNIILNRDRKLKLEKINESR